MIELNWRPTDRQLRQFGILGALLLPAIVYGWSHSLTAAFYTALVGFFVAFLGMLFPKLLRPLFVGISLITFPIGLVVSELLLCFLYFGVITPVGWLHRIVAGDRFGWRPDPRSASYWRAKKKPNTVGDYYRQF